MCTVRIMCLAKMTFVEDTLGESVVRCTSAAISILIGTAVSVFLLLKGEITMGSLLTYTSDNTVHAGELQNSFLKIQWVPLNGITDHGINRFMGSFLS